MTTGNLWNFPKCPLAESWEVFPLLPWERKELRGMGRKSSLLSSTALLDSNFLFCCQEWNHTCGILHFSLLRLCRDERRGLLHPWASQDVALQETGITLDSLSFCSCWNVENKTSQHWFLWLIKIKFWGCSLKQWIKEIKINWILWHFKRNSQAQEKKNPSSECWYFHFTWLVKQHRNLYTNRTFNCVQGGKYPVDGLLFIVWEWKQDLSNQKKGSLNF